jgi:hypothetical protein
VCDGRRSAHGDHDRIELRRGGCAIDIRRPTPISGERPQIGDHADGFVPGAQLARATSPERTNACAHGISAHPAQSPNDFLGAF